jgi:hypothetical protein
MLYLYNNTKELHATDAIALLIPLQGTFRRAASH